MPTREAPPIVPSGHPALEARAPGHAALVTLQSCASECQAPRIQLFVRLFVMPVRRSPARSILRATPSRDMHTRSTANARAFVCCVCARGAQGLLVVSRARACLLTCVYVCTVGTPSGGCGIHSFHHFQCTLIIFRSCARRCRIRGQEVFWIGSGLAEAAAKNRSNERCHECTKGRIQREGL